MLVSVDVIPVTGQTLPLISMGGTSIVFSCISVGIVLSISRNSLEGEYEKA
jgi:cell division protein FtsW